MKSKRLTTKQFVAQTTTKKIRISDEDPIIDNFKNLLYRERYKSLSEYHRVREMSMVHKDDLFLCYFNVKYPKRVGNNIFLTTSTEGGVVVSSKGVKISRVAHNEMLLMLQALGIDTFRDLESSLAMYLHKPSILRSVLIKTIYNEETLVKAIGRRCFHLKKFSWKNLRKFLCHGPNVSINDLRDFTTNVEKSIDVLVNTPEFSDDAKLLKDSLDTAAQLNLKINLTWSKKRLAEEHLKHTRMLIAEEIGSKEQTPIFESEVNGEHIKMLNTEAQIFEEGMTMHHCVYTCYYNIIANRKYMAWHMTFPEDCTFSVYKNCGKIVFDQIFLAYDRQVDASTRNAAQQFVQEHEAQISQLLSDRYTKQPRPTINWPEPALGEPIPL